MREAIGKALQALAADRSVRILHACESGSRAWGFASPDSDWDVRFLYVHELDWYLRVFPGDDTIACMLPGDLDLSGWDLRKALGLFAKSNVTLYEHLGSDQVYIDGGAVAARLRELVPVFFDPIAGGHHYLSLARRMHETHFGVPTVNVKKLFYVLRPLAALQWIAEHGTMPPTRFQAVLDGIELGAAPRRWIAELHAQKLAAREGDAVPLAGAVRGWIDAWLERGREVAKALPSRRSPSEPLDRLLVDVLRG